MKKPAPKDAAATLVPPEDDMTARRTSDANEQTAVLQRPPLGELEQRLLELEQRLRGLEQRLDDETTQTQPVLKDSAK
jgi:hypothetical protein